jgi:hypothetical protein
VANMITFDIEKFKMQRIKMYYQTVSEIGASNIDELLKIMEYYEKLNNIVD